MKKPIFLISGAIAVPVLLLLAAPVILMVSRKLEANEPNNPAVICGYHVIGVAVYFITAAALLLVLLSGLSAIRREKNWQGSLPFGLPSLLLLAFVWGSLLMG